MNWLKQILTGQDNETLAIGRVIGIVVALVFLLLVPAAAIVTIGFGLITAADWGQVLEKMQVYVPAITLAVGGLIGLTAPAERKASSND